MVHGHMPGQTNAPTSLAKLAMAVDLIIGEAACKMTRTKKMRRLYVFKHFKQT